MRLGEQHVIEIAQRAGGALEQALAAFDGPEPVGAEQGRYFLLELLLAQIQAALAALDAPISSRTVTSSGPTTASSKAGASAAALARASTSRRLPSRLRVSS